MSRLFIDFSNLDFSEHPTLILKTADGTPIAQLGRAFNIHGEFRYHEMSSISFDIPAYADGIPTPEYDRINGMMIVEFVGFGQYVLVNPSVLKDGISEIKSCKAYSLEYELTYKKMSLEEGTYNFYNPVTPNDTIIGIILSYLPSWSVGEIDPALYGKYRTFSVSNENIYNVIKNTLEDAYGCVFIFDTYNRRIYAVSVSTFVGTAPVMISLDNLAKEISIDEDTENIFTVLDVNGADGVTIRSVNPTGTNKIYNLDYFMNSGNFTDIMIAKWDEWKSAYEMYRPIYFTKTVEQSILTSKILIKENELLEKEKVELASAKNMQSAYVSYLASISVTSPSYEEYSRRLQETNAAIEELEAEVIAINGELESLKDQKDAITNELISINRAVSMSEYFTREELIILDRYFKEDAIEESSFVYSEVENYSDTDSFHNVEFINYAVSGSKIEAVEVSSERKIYDMRGGMIRFGQNSSELVRATLERKSNGEFLFTSYLGVGSYNSVSHPSGCLVVSGVCDDIDEMSDDFGYLSIEFFASYAEEYFTRNTTEYQRRSVEWDLLDYGEETLRKLAYPKYTFDVDSANFFAIKDFEAFTKNISLGAKIYLDTGEQILIPIFVGADIDFENIGSLKLSFGDVYSLSDSAFELVDLLNKSVSMGKTVDTSRFGYNSFINSGASSTVKDYIENALDVSRQEILSGGDQAISWDSSGLHLRAMNDSGTGFKPEQIAMINNNIVFTDDNWQTAKMAIGHFTDDNLGSSWGIVAPNIVGTLLAGENLVIESAKQDGGVSVFKVDADGAVLHNASFTVDNGVSVIVLDPELGFGIGDTNLISYDGDERSFDEDHAKFWVDTDGNLHLKGNLSGCTGSFSGTVDASDFLVNGESALSNGKFGRKFLDLGNIQLDGENGDITMTGNIDLSKASTINFGRFAPEADVTFDNILAAMKAAHGVENTFITADSVGSPVLYGAKIFGGEIYAVGGEQSIDGAYSKMTDDGFFIYRSATGDNTPKLALTTTTTGNKIRAEFGAGSGSSVSDDGKLIVEKLASNASIYYQTGGQQYGFRFDSSGITMLGGTLSTDVHVVFG